MNPWPSACKADATTAAPHPHGKHISFIVNIKHQIKYTQIYQAKALYCLTKKISNDRLGIIGLYIIILLAEIVTIDNCDICSFMYIFWKYIKIKLIT